MANVLSDEKRQQVLALGRLKWPLRRIEEATGGRRETASAYLKAAGIAVRPPGSWGRRPPNPANETSTDLGAKPANEASTDSTAQCAAAPRSGPRETLLGSWHAEQGGELPERHLSDLSLELVTPMTRAQGLKGADP